MVVAFQVLCFNSTLVQLKVNIINSNTNNVTKFQFYLSSIKSQIKRTQKLISIHVSILP